MQAPMKAIVAETLGDPDVLQLRELEPPEPGEDRILVKVEAAGVNYADALMRAGQYPGGPEAGFVPGLEVAGTIASGPKAGQAVMGITWTGGYAEYACLSEGYYFPIPKGLSKVEAAGFLVTNLTAYSALWMADLKPDERVLVHAAAGGVGTAAVQLARNMGAEIFATASSEEKLARARQLGAEHAINYVESDYVAEIRRLTEEEGIDVVLEPLAGSAVEQDLGLLRPLGRMILYGGLGGESAALEPSTLMLRNVSVHGLYLGGLLGQAELLQQAMAEMFEYIRRGKLKCIVGAQFPLAEAAAAHRLLESRASIGKIVLTIS